MTEVLVSRDGDMWVAEADALPIATEASTLSLLVERVCAIAPEIAQLNGLSVEPIFVFRIKKGRVAAVRS